MATSPTATNATPTVTSSTTSSTRAVPTMFHAKDFVTVGYPPFVRPTVSLDPRPVVIPILSCVIGFPIAAFAIICALRHRALRLRRRDQLRKLQAGIRSVTLDIPPKERFSFFSGGSSPDLSLRHYGEQDSLAYSTSSVPSRRSSKNNNHVKFMTTAVTHSGSDGGKQNGKIFLDEPSYIENGIELREEMCHSAAR